DRLKCGHVVAGQKLSNFRLKDDARTPILHQPGRLLVDINFVAQRPKGDGVEQPTERAADHHDLRGRAMSLQHGDFPPGPMVQTLPSSSGSASACSKAARKSLGSLAPDRASVLLMTKNGTPCTPARRDCSSAALISGTPSSPCSTPSALLRSRPASATTS